MRLAMSREGATPVECAAGRVRRACTRRAAEKLRALARDGGSGDAVPLLRHDPRAGRRPARFSRAARRRGRRRARHVPEPGARLRDASSRRRCRVSSRFIRANESDIKRETEEAATGVRVMTVHGAKGLEADVVFLADTGGRGRRARQRSKLVDDRRGSRRSGVPLAARMQPKRRSCSAMPMRVEDEETEQEYLRLLYVAMTRARDVLYVAGVRLLTAAERTLVHDRRAMRWCRKSVDARRGGRARRAVPMAAVAARRRSARARRKPLRRPSASQPPRIG